MNHSLCSYRNNVHLTLLPSCY